jgi:hypothetical protein
VDSGKTVWKNTLPGLKQVWVVLSQYYFFFGLHPPSHFTYFFLVSSSNKVGGCGKYKCHLMGILCVRINRRCSYIDKNVWYIDVMYIEYRYIYRPVILHALSFVLKCKMLPSSLELVLVAFILILPFLYETSRAFRYYIKFFLYYGIVMSTAVVVIPIMMCRPKDVKNLLYVFANWSFP